MALPTTTSISKLLAQLNILKKTNPDSTTKYVVLIQTGSYSPIRNVHIEALEVARAKIELSDLSFKVIGGYISLNGDFDVSRKHGNSSIPLLHRQSMAFIATKSSDWIDVDLSRRNSTDNITSAAVRLQNYLKDSLGSTALHTAAIGGHIGVAKALIKCGADTTIRDCYGFTALNLIDDEKTSYIQTSWKT